MIQEPTLRHGVLIFPPPSRNHSIRLRYTMSLLQILLGAHHPWLIQHGSASVALASQAVATVTATIISSTVHVVSNTVVAAGRFGTVALAKYREERLGAVVKTALMSRETEDEEDTDNQLFCTDSETVFTDKPNLRRMIRFAKILARDVRLKMGPCPNTTEANRLVAHELVVKAMVARDVRKNLRLEFSQLAVPLVFLPDVMDITMKKVVTSAAVSDLIAEYEKGDPVSLWEWLTRRRRKHLLWRKT